MIEGTSQTPDTNSPEMPGKDPMQIGGTVSTRVGRLLSCDAKRASPSVASLLRRLSAD